MDNTIRKILHISDLHISVSEKSMLQNDNYFECFVNTMKDIKSKVQCLDTLIISGDIVNKGGSEQDMEIACRIIQKIIDDIEIQYITIVPGNHDVNRDILNALKGKKNVDIENLYKYQNEKLEYFMQINKFIETDFDKSIININILQNPNIIILGINSAYKIGKDDGIGFIDEVSLNNELSNLFNGTNYDEYLKIAVFHHNPIIYNNELQPSEPIITFDQSNWKKVSRILVKYNINTVFTGHVHGTQSKKIEEYENTNDSIYYSTVGSIGVNFNNELVTIFKAIDENKLNPTDIPKYKNVNQYLDNGDSNLSVFNLHNSFNIVSISENKITEVDEYKFFKDEGKGKWINWKNKKIDNNNSIFSNPPTKILKNEIESFDYEKFLFKTLSEKQLYKTGHFHWKGNKTLNWIDTSYLLNNRNVLRIVSQGFCSKFDKILSEAEWIIGVGIKGSVIMSSLRYSYAKSNFTYCPEDSSNHNKYEKNLGILTKVKNIVVIQDVVHSGNTIKNFIDSYSELLDRNCIVNVLCIFNTAVDGKIIKEHKGIDIKMDSLAILKIKNCAGGTACPVIDNKLDIVYEN